MIGNLSSDDLYDYVYEGRQLVYLESKDNTQKVEYRYNADGIRVYKWVSELIDSWGNVGNYSYSSYYLSGNKIIGEKIIEGILTQSGYQMNEKNLFFTYDENNRPISISIQNVNDGTTQTYYYIVNLLGDIVGIVDVNGNLVAEYEYDAFGNILNEANLTVVGTLNPFRYRGYYYDSETSLYYCNARYYNPELGRWITPDDVGYLDSSNANGLNLYSYCGNNRAPVRRFIYSW